jgi:spore germination cell wall hydrolase CwlJ-like protein
MFSDHSSLTGVVNMKRIITFATLFFTLATGCGAQVSYKNATEEQLVAATLILEAGGEKDPRAMVAVYEVLYNRATKRGTSPAHEAFRRKQFSCWNNIEKRSALFRKATNHSKFDKAYSIVCAGKNTNITDGADHYHANYVNPYWAKSMTKTTTIENHIFYR